MTKLIPLMKLTAEVDFLFCCDLRFEKLPEVMDIKVWPRSESCYDIQIQQRRFLVRKTFHASIWLRTVPSIALGQCLLAEIASGLAVSIATGPAESKANNRIVLDYKRAQSVWARYHFRMSKPGALLTGTVARFPRYQ
jgi:hypothetical protein